MVGPVERGSRIKAARGSRAWRKITQRGPMFPPAMERSARPSSPRTRSARIFDERPRLAQGALGNFRGRPVAFFVRRICAARWLGSARFVSYERMGVSIGTGRGPPGGRGWLDDVRWSVRSGMRLLLMMFGRGRRDRRRGRSRGGGRRRRRAGMGRGRQGLDEEWP
jgi:hypothetical protein